MTFDLTRHLVPILISRDFQQTNKTEIPPKPFEVPFTHNHRRPVALKVKAKSFLSSVGYHRVINSPDWLAQYQAARDTSDIATALFWKLHNHDDDDDNKKLAADETESCLRTQETMLIHSSLN